LNRKQRGIRISHKSRKMEKVKETPVRKKGFKEKRGGGFQKGEKRLHQKTQLNRKNGKR